ncbi:DUF3100 domain-containing protein [Methanobrevibacter sp.]|uniref:DUF3100 domain-containing protein n=1 Tax=Methanobrevibacter sp. TaxID=66852 RepID=UPI002600F261|nr:DUF3100 domain-containing protein [Methanobrevibacter sp.]
MIPSCLDVLYIVIQSFRRDFISDNHAHRRDKRYRFKQHRFRRRADRAIKRSPPWKEYNLHLIILVLVVISMFIGIIEIKITDTISFLLLPLIYSLVMGLVLYLSKSFKWIGPEQAKVAEGVMVLLIGVLLSKLAISSGQSIDVIFHVGPALVLQLLGDLGTLIALPVALLLGFRREVIGMASSICREPNLGIIIDKYGFNSPEARGVLAIFVIGSIIGTPYISFLSSISVSLIPFHPYAFAMASGIGSASMNAAALVPLVHMYPAMATQLEAFAGASNILSFCLGMYMCIFVSLPIAERLYKWLSPILGKGDAHIDDDEYVPDEVTDEEDSDGLSFGKLKRWAALLFAFSVIVAIGNVVGYHTAFVGTFIGMIIIAFVALIGMSLERVFPVHIPSIVFISLIGLLISIPGVPTADFVSHYVSQVELTTICTAFLAYVGVSIGKDWEEFKRIGWRGIIVAIVVITGTYLGSATIANITLFLTGMI